MQTINLLYKDRYPINDKISVMIPKVDDVLRDEDLYYGAVGMLTAAPIDMMVQLDDAHIDFSTINDYDLFLLLFPELRKMDTSLIFGNLDLSKFDLAINSQNDKVVLLDRENDIVIDRSIHGQIAATLRRIHFLERNRHKPANEEAKQYMLERARIKMNRHKNKKHDSQLEPLIISMVNTEQFKYDFERTKELSIYQFNASVRQVIKKVDYDNRMYGVYTGNISTKDLSHDDLTWLCLK